MQYSIYLSPLKKKFEFIKNSPFKKYVKSKYSFRFSLCIKYYYKSSLNLYSDTIPKKVFLINFFLEDNPPQKAN